MRAAGLAEEQPLTEPATIVPMLISAAAAPATLKRLARVITNRTSAAALSDAEAALALRARHRVPNQRLAPFRPIVRLGPNGTEPDATIIWLFRVRLVKAKAINRWCFFRQVAGTCKIVSLSSGESMSV